MNPDQRRAGNKKLKRYLAVLGSGVLFPLLWLVVDRELVWERRLPAIWRWLNEGHGITGWGLAALAAGAVPGSVALGLVLVERRRGRKREKNVRALEQEVAEASGALNEARKEFARNRKAEAERKPTEIADVWYPHGGLGWELTEFFFSNCKMPAGDASPGLLESWVRGPLCPKENCKREVSEEVMAGRPCGDCGQQFELAAALKERIASYDPHSIVHRHDPMAHPLHLARVEVYKKAQAEERTKKLKKPVPRGPAPVAGRGRRMPSWSDATEAMRRGEPPPF